MPHRLTHRNRSWRRADVGIALVLGFAAGCSTFRTASAPTVDRPDKPPALATGIAGVSPPSKYSLRASQFVFYSDVELKAENPLFVELGELRDQVFRELQLPTSNTLIQVYLF